MPIVRSHLYCACGFYLLLVADLYFLHFFNAYVYIIFILKN